MLAATLRPASPAIFKGRELKIHSVMKEEDSISPSPYRVGETLTLHRRPELNDSFSPSQERRM